MKEEIYKQAWAEFSQRPTIEYSPEDIENIIGGQVKETQHGVIKYLRFDLILKSVAVLSLVVLSYLFRGSQSIVTISAGMVIGVISSLFQASQLNRMNPGYDFSLPVQSLLAAILKNLRHHLKVAGILVGLTNPLIILVGSYFYYFNKYGAGYSQDLQDLFVTLLLLSIGFILGFLSFSMQQVSVLTDLEISQATLEYENNDGLAIVVKRRKRRMLLSTVLIIIGFIVFLSLLGTFLAVF